MKTVKFFTDTETSGLLKEADQIFTFSVIIEEVGGQNVEEYEKQIVMKDNVMPNARALLVNNINPFSAEWKKGSSMEFEACLHLVELSKKYQRENKRIVLIAYNAEFDETMYRDMFKRCGYDFATYFPVIWDPLPTVKKLIEQEIIVTPEIQTSYSKSYRTSKLEAVYKALGNDSSGFKAHTALDDTKMLQVVAHGIYFLAVGKKLEDMNAYPDAYKINDVVHLVTEESSGVVKKHIKVIYNDLNNQKLLVVDEELIKGQSPESAITWLPYSKILDELENDKTGSSRVDSYYTSHQQVMTEAANMLLSKKEKKTAAPVEFSKITALADKMLSASNKKKEKATLSEEELELLPQAEDYAFAKFNKGWTREIEGDDFLSAPKTMALGKYTLISDPLGFYRLLDNDLEIIKTEKKTEIQDKLQNLLGVERDNEEFKKMVKSIPSTKDFKNPKHPSLLKEEYENAQGEVFQGSNKVQKEILTDLLIYYKKKAPAFFTEVNQPSFKLDLSSLMKKKPV